MYIFTPILSILFTLNKPFSLYFYCFPSCSILLFLNIFLRPIHLFLYPYHFNNFSIIYDISFIRSRLSTSYLLLIHFKYSLKYLIQHDAVPSTHFYHLFVHIVPLFYLKLSLFSFICLYIKHTVFLSYQPCHPFH